jgi:light-regulated signal transduction histidine kinase (bacteriophytochrome)
LNKEPPDLAEIGEALGCVVDDVHRAGQIIDRIREHIKKAPPRNDRFDLNEAIDEVIGLARSTIAKNGVSVQTRLTEGLPAVHGDRVQLQQVVLNLILNAVEAMSVVDEGVRELLLSTEQTRRTASSSRCVILGQALIRNVASTFSTLSTRQNPAASGWDCRSAGPSSAPMEAGYGSRRINLSALYLSLSYPSWKGIHEFSSSWSPEWRAARTHRNKCS